MCTVDNSVEKYEGKNVISGFPQFWNFSLSVNTYFIHDKNEMIL